MDRTFVVASALVVAIAPAVSAQAPPTGEPRFFAGEITAGTIVVGELQVSELFGIADLAGPGFHIVGTMAPGPYFAPCNETLLCVSGFEVDLGSMTFGYFSGFTIHGGRVTVNGETLQPANVRLGWPLLDADPVAIPRGNRKKLVLSAPFVLTDFLNFSPSQVLEVRVHHPDDFDHEHPWAIGQISGAGVVTGFFERQIYRERNEPGPHTSIFYYVLERLIYSFNAP